MPRKVRRALASEAQRRSQERRSRIAADVISMRRRRSWTQADLAKRAGLGRMMVSRLERATGSIDVDTLERVALALDVSLNCGFARDLRADVADGAHLAIQELVLRLGRRNGYEAAFELATRQAEPWRSIDVVLASEARERMLCIECWNTIGDIGAAVRTSARKAAELEAMAIARWGAAATTALVWVVRATARNRALLERYPESFASRFRGSSQRWVAALVDGGDPPPEPGLVWCDISATRLFAWRHASDRRAG